MKKLRPTHFEQILGYVKAAEIQGDYYGNKQHFNKRHIEIREWIEELYKSATGK